LGVLVDEEEEVREVSGRLGFEQLCYKTRRVERWLESLEEPPLQRYVAAIVL
jgi:hypothetical protein